MEILNSFECIQKKYPDLPPPLYLIGGYAHAITSLSLEIIMKFLNKVHSGEVPAAATTQIYECVVKGNFCQAKCLLDSSVLEVPLEEEPDTFFIKMRESCLLPPQLAVSLSSYCDSDVAKRLHNEDLLALRKHKTEVAFQLKKSEELAHVLAHEQPLQRDTEAIKCSLCAQDIEEGLFKLEKCPHSFHRPCISVKLVELIKARTFPIVCPLQSCLKQFHDLEIKSLLDEDWKDKYDTSVLSHYSRGTVHEVSCPRPHCKNTSLVIGNLVRITCSCCKHDFCSQCYVPFHSGLTCEEYLEDAKRNLRTCPGCQGKCNSSLFQRILIHCQCGREFCSFCLQEGCSCTN